MSASLVGSEMCIRDSHATAATPGWLPVPELVPSLWFVCPNLRPRGRGVAVSYTHLTLPTICSV
eukprot:10163780-Alexandrium_andersonii.AAC.1